MLSSSFEASRQCGECSHRCLMRQDGCRYTFEQLSHLKMVPRFLPVPDLALVTLMPVPFSSSSSSLGPSLCFVDTGSISPAADTNVVDVCGGGVPDSDSLAKEVNAAAAVEIVTALQRVQTYVRDTTMQNRRHPRRSTGGLSRIAQPPPSVA